MIVTRDEVTSLTFRPRLLSQVAELVSSPQETASRGSVEFRESSFLAENCEGLSARIDDLKLALRDSVEAIGQQASARSPEAAFIDGRFFDGDRRHAVESGSFIFVPAGQDHRFEEFSDDFAVWVFFYGPEVTAK